MNHFKLLMKSNQHPKYSVKSKLKQYSVSFLIGLVLLFDHLITQQLQY